MAVIFFDPKQKTVNVEDLIKVLATLPPKAKVMLSSDEEGNSFAPILAITTGTYSEWSGARMGTSFVEYHEDESETHPTAICLFPR